MKLRLSLLVVFSAGTGYLFGDQHGLSEPRFWILILAGFLVTGASNGFNQVFEKDLDKLMDRTAGRPLPTAKMSSREGLIVATLMGIVGIFLLVKYINLPSAILGLIALVSYSFMYTPMKKVSPFAVFVGAIPGAIPPMLGYVAFQGSLDLNAWLLFSVQFIWQFPHFWAIAWVLDEDYKKAGFKMLPSGERDRTSAFQTFVYTFGLIPISILPYLFNRINGLTAIVILIAGIIFCIQSWKFYKSLTVKSASKLMFGSFFYLPIVQVAMVLGKIQ